ncbi:GNAT family N-acetyltransferase [Nocardia sp. NBC_01503]|uniref:GNAT family N-acetyltransferase n=1 Tax=Nocardia sp. NBC_01503 TaxID=2975997 RepID=UPI002E7C05ED|nr:GNAT family N-acetyltransferase [Nocardia sp. NBC_01503]WTL35142.1 GNAT family N-acetyltransferase [Nocardia sp. NBC_01503]
MPRSIPAVVAADVFTKTVQPVIPVGEDLVLRPWLRRDAPEVYTAFQDPAIQRWHTRTAESVDEAGEWIGAWARAWSAGVDANWAVADSRTGRIAGRVAISDMVLSHGLAMVSYWVTPAMRGRGIAPLALGALTEWAFTEAGFHRLELRHSIHNSQSCRVAVKSGFALEGISRSAAMHIDGWHDMHLHARVHGDQPAETLPIALVSRARHRAEP